MQHIRTGLRKDKIIIQINLNLQIGQNAGILIVINCRIHLQIRSINLIKKDIQGINIIIIIQISIINLYRGKVNLETFFHCFQAN